MGSGSISSTTDEEISGNPKLDGWHSLNPRGSRQSGSRTACSLSLPPQFEGRELLQSGPRRQVIIPLFRVKSREKQFSTGQAAPQRLPFRVPSIHNCTASGIPNTSDAVIRISIWRRGAGSPEGAPGGFSCLPAAPLL